MAYTVRDLVLALISAFLGSVNGLLVHQVKSLGAIEIFGLRSVGAVCFIAPLIVYFGYQLWYDRRCNLILLLRAAIGNVAVCGYYYGFVNLPIAEASLLFYSTPLFTIVIGRVFLREQCGLSGVASVLLSVVGVCLVCVPDIQSGLQGRDATGVVKGVAGSLVGAVAQAVALVVVRKVTHVPVVVASLWWAVVGVVFSGAFYGVKESDARMWACGLESAFIVLIAVVGFVSELCLVSALKSTEAVIVSIALTSEIAWAFVFQTYVSGESPSAMSVVGAVAIVSSVATPVVERLVQRLPLLRFRTKVVDMQEKMAL